MSKPSFVLRRPASIAACIALGVLTSASAHAAGSVVISQAYGGGGNSGAVYTNDFVELFNRSSAPVSLAGWSVQYASATGTGNFGSNATLLAALPNVTLQPGQYFLLQLAAGGTAAGTLPTPDATGTINMSGTAGKVALVRSAGGLGCNGGSAACSPAQLALIEDLVGYGTANFFEGSAAAPATTNSTAVLRAGGGCTDTDANSADFATGAPLPRNTATPLAPCGTTNAPVIASCPATLNVVEGVGAVANVSASDADGVVGAVSITSPPVPGIGLASIAAGQTLTAQLTVDASTPSSLYSVTLQFPNQDAAPQTASCTIGVTVLPAAPSVRIRDIQGASHVSPLVGQSVFAVPGVVTAIRSNGFYIQDPQPDADVATSEGLFVFTSAAPTVAVGDSVLVNGTVAEFRPGGAGGFANLSITEIVGPSVSVVSGGNPLPPPIVIGSGGRAVPTQVIDDDATGDVESSGSFDAVADGIDFYESLEGMRVSIANPVAVGPTNDFGELPVVVDGGANAGLRTPRGGLIIRPADFNPERIVLDDGIAPVPAADVGDQLSSVVAIVDYSFGNFKFLVTSTPTVTDTGPAVEAATIVGDPRRLSVASYNVENLSVAGPAARFTAIADQIVNRLRSPDVVSLIEIQDDNGTTNDGNVSAAGTYAALVGAIATAGGPAYQVREIAPIDNADGGAPGGNIRVAFMFNPARVTFVDRPGGTATSGTTATSGPNGLQLTFSPGRVDPTQTAWTASRKPLAGEFLFNGRRVFLVANHFNSKGGDDPLFGRFQPPVRSSETQRVAQAATVSLFVQSLRAIDPQAAVVVLGDLNDFQFSDVLMLLKSGSGLVNLVDSLPEDSRYSYNFEGNAQTLDHILVSPTLATFASPEIDVVHVNSEYAAQVSDHDPLVATLALPRAGDVDGDGDIDRIDVAAITTARGAVPNGPYDPREVVVDGRIDVLDARRAAVLCTRPACATN